MSAMVSPYAFAAAGGGGAPTSTKWRLSFTDGADSSLELAEVEMRGVSGGPDLATGGTATASSYDVAGITYWPWHAFDDNGGSTYWRVSGDGPGDGSWLQYEFTSAVSIVEITIQQNWFNTGPRIFDVQYWNGAAWVTSWTVTTGAWNISSTETRTFTKP